VSWDLIEESICLANNEIVEVAEEPVAQVQRHFKKFPFTQKAPLRVRDPVPPKTK
jgi:hypothetical protein